MQHPSEHTFVQRDAIPGSAEGPGTLTSSQAVPSISVMQQPSETANKNDLGYLSPQAPHSLTSPPAPKRTGSPLRPVTQTHTATHFHDNSGLVDPEALQAFSRMNLGSFGPTAPAATRTQHAFPTAAAAPHPPAQVTNHTHAAQYAAPAHQTMPKAESSAGAAAPRTSHAVTPPSDESFRWTLGDYMLGRTIGAGSMGKVKYGHCKADGQKVAVKIVPRNTSVNALKQSRGKSKHTGQPLTEAELESAFARASTKDTSKEVRIVREGSLQMLLLHPYICRMREMITHPNHHYMVFEHINGGQMLDYIIAHGRLRERSARTFARQIGSALQYCHANNVVHRDLKIENILISKSGNIKIIDFGLSNMYTPQGHLNTFCGSLYFAAPELLNARVYTGPEVDIWSFGVVLYVLVCGKVPFDDQSMPVLHARIKRGMVEYPGWLSPDCKHLLSRMIEVNPLQRATLSEIMSHPWMMKDHHAPEPNYLPKRTPLSASDLDPAVIERMTGFEFGSPQDIHQQLLSVLRSESYLDAVARHEHGHTQHLEAVPPNSGASSVDAPRGNRISRQITAGLNFYHRHMFKSSDTPSPSSATVEGPPGIKGPIHPAYGFHPLISVYFLVKEKMERERFGGSEVLNSSDLLLPQSGTVGHSQHAPPQDVPESAAIEHLDQVSLSASMPTSAAAVPAPSSAASPPPHPSSSYSGMAHPASSAIGRLVADIPSPTVRPPERSHVSSRTVGAAASVPLPPSPLPPTAALMAGPDSTTPVFESRQKSQPMAVMMGPPRPLAHADELESSLRSGMKSPTGLTDNYVARTSPISPVFERKAILQRSMSMNHARHARHVEQGRAARDGRAYAVQLSDAARPLPTLDAIQSEAGLGLFTGEAPEVSNSMASDSVTGAGANLTRRFGTMSARPSHNTSNVIVPPPDLFSGQTHAYAVETGASNTPDMHTSLDEATSKPVFLKGLFSVQTTSRRPRAIIRRDLIRVLEQFGVHYSETKSGFECSYQAPLIETDSLGSPKRSTSHLSSAATSSPIAGAAFTSMQQSHSPVATGVGDIGIDAATPSEGVLSTPAFDSTPTKSGAGKPRLSEDEVEVVFEICIVKVPLLLGMNGLQFRRVSGNPWQYQTLAKRILNELNL